MVRVRFPSQRKQAVASVFHNDRSRGVGLATVDDCNRLEDVLHIAGIQTAPAAVGDEEISQCLREELRIRQQLSVAFQIQTRFGKQGIQKTGLHQCALDGIAFLIGQVGPKIDTGVERFSRNARLHQLFAVVPAGLATFRNRILFILPGTDFFFVLRDGIPYQFHPAPDRQQLIADALFLIVGSRVDRLSHERESDRFRIQPF